MAPLRAKLSHYEDTGLEPDDVTALIAAHDTVKDLLALALTPPNDPLTLDELREMDGEPVWIKRRDGCISGWAIFGDMQSPYGVYCGTARGGLRLPYDGYSKTWLAYRRKPEEK